MTLSTVNQKYINGNVAIAVAAGVITILIFLTLQSHAKFAEVREVQIHLQRLKSATNLTRC